jgi:hypothetical protein
MVAIVMGAEEDFNSVLYGANKHPGTVEYLRNQVYSMAQNFGGMMNDAVSSFVGRAQAAFEAVNGEAAMRRARAAIGRASAAFQRDVIRGLNTLQELQQAPFVMQRFIMAEPMVRNLYHKQRCDGYSDTYVDMFPQDVGKNHYDYRLVMDGQVTIFENEDGEDDWMVTHYPDDYLGTDQKMPSIDQVHVRDAWRLARNTIRRGKDDPVSAHGGVL